MHFSILGSGSAGNSTVITGEHGALLVDAGLSALQLRRRLDALGIRPDSLQGVLLTHEHGDHTRGLDVLLRTLDLPVYCNPHTRQILAPHFKEKPRWCLVETGSSFQAAGFHIDTFPVPHDAVDPIGFLLTDGRRRLGIVSDLGHPTPVLYQRLTDLDALFIEANYCPDLLAADVKRPWSTKQRISSRHGHLSNDQTAEFVAAIATPRLRRVILGHLSRDCNSPALALKVLNHHLATAGHPAIHLHIASQDIPTELFAIPDPTPPQRPAPRPAIHLPLHQPEFALDL